VFFFVVVVLFKSESVNPDTFENCFCPHQHFQAFSKCYSPTLNFQKMLQLSYCKTLLRLSIKGILNFFFFLEIGSFYKSLRVKQLSFTIFESIQPIF